MVSLTLWYFEDLKMQTSQESKPPYQQALQELRSFLVSEVVVSEVIDHIIEVDGLTLDEQEQINVTPGDREKMRKLLNCLRSKGEDVFEAFMKGLRANNSDHVVKRLQEKINFIKQLKQDPRLFDEDPSQIRAPQDELDARPGQQEVHWLGHYPEHIRHSVPSDRLLTLIAMEIPDPSALGGLLSLPHSLSQQCRSDNPFNVVAQTVALLQGWKRSLGREASLEQLVKALESGKLMSDDIKRVIKEELKDQVGQISQIPRQSAQAGQMGRGNGKMVGGAIWL